MPFTYRLTIPVLFDPATGNVVDDAGSPNELHSIMITDDLNATGADLTYVSHTAVWEGGGTPVPHTFSNVGGLLTFSGIPIVAAETADRHRHHGRARGRAGERDRDAVRQHRQVGVRAAHRRRCSIQPLPGEWGISPPMTIAAPNIVVDEVGPGDVINLGAWAQFTVDVLNSGLTDAWKVTSKTGCRTARRAACAT